jgi:hypothetical protein
MSVRSLRLDGLDTVASEQLLKSFTYLPTLFFTLAHYA